MLTCNEGPRGAGRARERGRLARYRFEDLPAGGTIRIDQQPFGRLAYIAGECSVETAEGVAAGGVRREGAKATPVYRPALSPTVFDATRTLTHAGGTANGRSGYSPDSSTG